MKNKSLKLNIGFLLLLIASPAVIRAQTLVYPSLSDNIWYNSIVNPSYILGLNTAMIDYANGTIGQGSLMVSDYFANGTAGGVVFKDWPQGITVHVPYHVGGGPVPDFSILTPPDITVGNDATNPLTDYRVAVAYICYNTAANTVAPQIDYWLVHYTGAGAFTVSYICSDLFVGYHSSTIHIDVVAEYGNTAATGFPWCDSIKVVVDKYTSATAADLYCYSGSLNNPACDPVSPVFITSDARQPDVAAIQRLGSGLPPPVEDLALITYTDVTAAALNYIEYNTATAAISSPASLDLGGGSLSFSYPRIDAPDDYNINAPSMFISNYKVVVQANHTGPVTYTSNSYDNNTFGVSFNTYPGGTNEYAPTVAFGGCSSTQFQVAHGSDDNTIGGYPAWNTFMEPIDWSDAFNIAWAPGALTRDYYLVNLAPYNNMTDLANGMCVSAISTPCNNPSSKTLVAWSFQKILLGYSNVWYKITPYGVGGYSFRPGPDGVGAAAVKDWNVYPNPAAAELNIDIPAAGAAAYGITDMAGRTLLSGALPAGMNTVDVHTLGLGTYIINLYEGDSRSYTKMFVKQ